MPHATAPGRFDDVVMGLEVIQQEIGRVVVVGLDATYLRGRKHYDRGLVLGKPALHCRALNIKPIRTKFFTPQTNGKAERFIKTLLA